MDGDMIVIYGETSSGEQKPILIDDNGRVLVVTTD